MSARLIAACVALAMLVAGPLQTLAAQPVATTEVDPSAQPAMESRAPRTDVYDVAAPVVTALKMPFNVGLCAAGGVVGFAVFVLTFGSGYRASARVVEEGCQGPWLIRGEDLRPEPPRTDILVGAP